MTSNTYTQLQHPTPSPAYANYPFFTPGGGDRRWIGTPETEDGLHWVGPLMYVFVFSFPPSSGIRCSNVDNNKNCPSSPPMLFRSALPCPCCLEIFFIVCTLIG